MGNRHGVKDGLVADLKLLDLRPGRLACNIHTMDNVLLVLFDVVWHAVVPEQERSKHGSDADRLRFWRDADHTQLFSSQVSHVFDDASRDEER